MDALSVITSNGTVSVQVALIVGHLIYMIIRERQIQAELNRMETKMTRNDDIFKEIQTNVTKLLVGQEYTQETLKELKDAIRSIKK